jgi:hypothetical protein
MFWRYFCFLAKIVTKHIIHYINKKIQNYKQIKQSQRRCDPLPAVQDIFGKTKHRINDQSFSVIQYYFSRIKTKNLMLD